MNLLGRAKHPRRPLHTRTLTRTSSTPQTPHATPTAAFSSGRPTPYKLRPTSSSRGAYIRYRKTTTTPLLSPNTSTTISIFASLLPRKATSQISSSASTPASTQPFASSTPSTAPPAGPNQNTDADASHPHPFGRPRGDDDLDPGNSSNNHASSSMENSSSAQNNQDPASGGDHGGGSLPALPAPNRDGSTNSPDGSGTTTLEVDGKAVVLDHLGPMVIGRDGTVSRISNWQEMSERERQNALRILGKRNQVRLAALRGEEAAGSSSKAA